MELIIITTTIALFIIAALLEIGGGYLVWKWLKEKKSVIFGILGGITLFIYGIVPTFQPSHFGRVYSAYGGIFIISSIAWGFAVDKKKPDMQEIIGAVVTLIGALIIFYAPR